MKPILSHAQDIGTDGAKIIAELGVVGLDLAFTTRVSYPIQKLIEPAQKALDSALDALAAKIPGTWDDAIFAGLKADFQAKIVQAILEEQAKQA